MVKIVFYKDLKGNALDAYNQGREKMYAMAEKELQKPRSDLICRLLRPEDIGSPYPSFSQSLPTLATPGWTTGGTGLRNYANTVTIADNRFIMINGVSDRSTGVSQIKISRSGSDTRIWNIQQIPDNEDNICYVDDPVIIPQNHQLTIQAYAVASQTEYIRFIGAVVEPVGLLLAGRRGEF